MARKAKFAAGTIRRCPCGYEGNVFQINGHRAHTNNPICRQAEPTIVSGALAKDLPPPLPPQIPFATTAPEPVPHQEPTATYDQSDDAESGYDGDEQPDNRTAANPFAPKPGSAGAVKWTPKPTTGTETINIPGPPTGAVTVQLSAKTFSWWNVDVGQFGYDGTFAEWIDEHIDYSHECLGWDIRAVPRSLINAESA